MPVKSIAQLGFMGASKTLKGRARLRAHGKTPAPQKVADEFLKASKGKTKGLPKHAGTARLRRIKGARDLDNSE